MRHPVRHLPLAMLGAILLLIQVLAVGLGSGTRICIDPVCADVALATSDGCCGESCTDPAPAVPVDDPCVCAWTPIDDGPLAELAVLAAPATVLTTTVPPVLQVVPARPARDVVRPTIQRPPPHLSAQRCILLTC